MACVVAAGIRVVSLVVAVIVAGAWSAPPVAAQAPTADLKVTRGAGPKRVALVVGQSRYQHIPALANPKSDAALMASTLREVGFTLIGGGPQLDLDKPGLDRAVQQFGQQIVGADAALFYYAGHGLQVGGANWLVPVTANPTREVDLDFQMVDAQLVLRQMEGAGTKLNLMILDACRNNPFGGRGLRAATGGLAQMKAPEGTLISYATQPGNVAIDGADGNSPFTKALAGTMKRPGLDVFRLFNEVGLQVKQATSGAQQPWVSNSPIDGDFYFMQVPAGSTVTIQPPGAAAPAPAVDREVVLWNSVKDSRNPALLQTYLDQFPQGTFAGAARVLIADLSKPPVAKTQVAAAPARTDLASLLASPPPINPKVDQLYATGLAELPNYRFGRSLAAVSNASWLQLPVAGEFRRNEVRYFFQSTRQLMPNWSALGCVSAKSYILFMFESQELVGLSIRFLGDNECPNHRAWLEHFAGLVGAPVVELDRGVGLFRAAGSSVEVRGLSIPHKGATAIDIMPQRASGLMTDLEWVEFHRN